MNDDENRIGNRLRSMRENLMGARRAKLNGRLGLGSMYLSDFREDYEILIMEMQIKEFGRPLAEPLPWIAAIRASGIEH